MKNIAPNPYIVVRNADKGGAVTVLDSDLYRKLNLDILNDHDTYRRLPSDPTSIYQCELQSLLALGVRMGVLSQNDSEKIFVSHPVTPVFHSLPKLHKEVFFIEADSGGYWLNGGVIKRLGGFVFTTVGVHLACVTQNT